MNRPCPILLQMDETIYDLRKAFRKIRRLFATCRSCGQPLDCPIREQFRHQIDELIRQIHREWQGTP